MEYDKVGNITATKDAYGITTNQTVYDSLSRPTKSTDSLGNTSVIKYNQWSDVTETVNALNQTTQFDYYDIGLVSVVTDANSGVTEQSYDNMTQQSSFTDANGNTTSFSYDKAGRTTSINLQNGATICYEYNNKGYLSKTTNARGQAFTYEYDKLGRLTKTTKPDGFVSTTYDTNGNILTKSDENGIVTFTYDKLNRPTSYTDVYGNHLGYTYDLNSNLTQLEYLDGKVVKYTYNANNQLVTVVDWNNRQTEYTYDKNGRLTSTQRSNGTSENRVYDTKGQLTSLSEQATNGLTVRQTIFTYDALGNITSEETTGIGQESVVYAYDKLNRVTNSTNSLKENSYIYDKQGNILSILSHNLAPTTTLDSATVTSSDTVTITSEDYATITSTEDSALIELGYGDNNWLTSINSQPITYDVDGNALQTLLNDDLVSLEYDSLNRLVRSGTTSYRYDVNNNRIEVQDQNDTTQFVVNPLSQYSQVLVETDDTGRIVKRYIYGIGLIGEETLDNTYITYHYDYRGSTVFLTDEQGEVTLEFKYDTYGELLSPHEGYRFLYNGRDGVETDLNGLYYMRARYYNPDIKRFVNQDILLGSLGDSASLNRYAYVNGNPVSLIDPFGLEAQSGWMDGAYNSFIRNRETLLELPYAAMSVHTYDLTINIGTGQWNLIGGNLKSVIVEAASTPRKGSSTGAKYLGVYVDSYRNAKKQSKSLGQAHHLNQDAAYRDVINKMEGLATPLKGNAFKDIGSPHYKAHESLETFWNQYRRGGSKFLDLPTNSEYHNALVQSLEYAGLTPIEAKQAAEKARQQRLDYGLGDSQKVPRLPGRINQKR